jgi:hypothetical protein
MFEMLLASDVGSLSWKRSAVLAIALHGAAVAVVTGGTDAPYERPLPRDTIRVDLRLAQAFRPRPWLQEPHQSPELPTPPAVVIPAMRFDRPVLDLRVATVAPRPVQRPSVHLSRLFGPPSRSRATPGGLHPFRHGCRPLSGACWRGSTPVSGGASGERVEWTGGVGVCDLEQWPSRSGNDAGANQPTPRVFQGSHRRAGGRSFQAGTSTWCSGPGARASVDPVSEPMTPLLAKRPGKGNIGP